MGRTSRVFAGNPLVRTDTIGLAPAQWLCGMKSINKIPQPMPPLAKPMCAYTIACFKLLDVMGYDYLNSVGLGTVAYVPKAPCSKCPSYCVFTYYGEHPSQAIVEGAPFNVVCVGGKK